MKTCFQCQNYSDGSCLRPMKMLDGRTMRLLRPCQTERDEKHKFWRDKGRDMGDVCGASGRNWIER